MTLKYIAKIRFSLGCTFALLLWWLLPDKFMGPYNAWNPHALMEFVITLFTISFAGQWAIQKFGAHYGLLITGLMGGFASSTATIHNMGTIAKADPSLAARAALSGVLSNVATMVQLLILQKLLAPALFSVTFVPIVCGLVAVIVYAALILKGHPTGTVAKVNSPHSMTIDWKGLLILMAIVGSLSLVTAALNTVYGQNGLWLGAVLSGLVDAHALVPTLASLLRQDKILLQEAVLPLLMSLTANTLTKSLLAFQSGGLHYAKSVSVGIWVTTASVWLGYFQSSVTLK
jgi:uncharacterized membrane protein (DUF4010 family)